jgi:hypothetical protein
MGVPVWEKAGWSSSRVLRNNSKTGTRMEKRGLGLWLGQRVQQGTLVLLPLRFRNKRRKTKYLTHTKSAQPNGAPPDMLAGRLPAGRLISRVTTAAAARVVDCPGSSKPFVWRNFAK